MPTYDYRCKACKYEFEEFQSITAPNLKKCPKCGKAKLERLIGTGSAVIFKGSGFYETDYRSDSYKKDAKSDSDKSSPKTEGDKPAAKSDGEKVAPKTETDSKPAEKSDAPVKEAEPVAESKPTPAAKTDKKKSKS